MYRRYSAKFLGLLLLAWFAGPFGMLRSEPAPTKPRPAAKDEKLVTATYNVADLLDKAPSWQSSNLFSLSGKRSAVPKQPLKALIWLVMADHPERWRGEGDSVSTLEVVNGTKLEIRATAKHQKEISDLLAAVRRLTDCAVLLEHHLFEMDRDWYQKNVERRLPKEQDGLAKAFAFVVPDDLEKELRKQTAPSRSGKVLLGTGKEGRFFSLQRSLVYQARLKEAGDDNIHETALHGVSLGARVAVTPDRREIMLRLEQKATELVEVQKRMVLHPVTLKPHQVEAPVLLDATTAMRLHLDDGLLLLVRLHYQPAALKARKRVLVLLLRPSVYIEEEERERNKGNNF